MINTKIGQAVRHNNTGTIDELIAGHNESLEAAKNQFPDYELPLTVQLDVHCHDLQRIFHREITSTLLRKYRTGRISKIHMVCQVKWPVDLRNNLKIHSGNPKSCL